MKNVEVSTPKNRLKRKCDLHFDISPISLRNATIDLASFECDQEPVNKTPKLSHEHKLPEIAEQVPLEENLLKAPDSKVARSELLKNNSNEMAGNSSDIPLEQIEISKESNRNKTLEVAEQKNKTSIRVPQLDENSFTVPELSINKQNGSKSIEKSHIVPELENSSFIVPELSPPSNKVRKMDNSSFVIPELEKSVTNVPENNRSKHKVVHFIDAPEENKASELEVSQTHNTISLRAGKWRRSLAVWRKSHNPAKVITRSSRRFIALFPMRTDPGVVQGYKRKLKESLEKCKYIIINHNTVYDALTIFNGHEKLKSELSTLDTLIHVLRNTAVQRLKIRNFQSFSRELIFNFSS